ncbi:MAG: hydroxymethylpyrimidine/phosphomethylpyrimidine kinase [Candidatus Aminicenantes bacterium]|nr:hydroxymethylpyrimidine/phosphomethylpyrimidine kinase [Candidatus Aminicenantes bacterium]
MARLKLQQTRTLLSIAGYDPSSGAGLVLDLAVFRKVGFAGMGLMTAATAQNTRQVVSFYTPPPRFLLLQYQALRHDVSFAGIKTGMVGYRKNIPVISRILSEHPRLPVVADPVFRASSGAWLLEKGAIPFYISHLKGKISVITPNLKEAALITGKKVRNLAEMKEAAQKIIDLVEAPCLIKGGHLARKATDLLYDGKRFYIFEKARIKKEVHGTGCFLSASLLCFLVKGYPLSKASELASAFTHAAIKKASRIGQGKPVFTMLL